MAHLKPLYRNLEAARALHPALQSFDAWLAQNKTHIPLG